MRLLSGIEVIEKDGPSQGDVHSDASRGAIMPFKLPRILCGSCGKRHVSGVPCGPLRKDWDASKHPRGEPGNAGEFGPGGGGTSSPTSTPSTNERVEGDDPNAPVHTSDVNEAARILGQGGRVELDQPDEVSTLLVKLKALTDDAISHGEKAPNYNLCGVTVKGTNLFCAESKNVPRVKMPQLTGHPIAGSLADSLPKDKRGNVDLSSAFRDHLTKGLGIKVTDTTAKASHLRASQNELNGAKVAGIFQARHEGTYDEAPLWTSRDNYIIDGHHRWASVVADGIGEGQDDLDIPITQADIGITDMLAEANAFAKKWGIAQADASGKYVTAPDPTPDDKTAGSVIDKAMANGGISWHPGDGSEPTDGYMVAVQGHSRILPDTTSDEEMVSALKDYVREKQDLFRANPNMHVGLWHDEEHHELTFDPSEHVADQDQATQLGRDRNQQSIWSVKNGTTIDTGGTGDRDQDQPRVGKAARGRERGRAGRLGQGHGGQGPPASLAPATSCLPVVLLARLEADGGRVRGSDQPARRDAPGVQRADQGNGLRLGLIKAFNADEARDPTGKWTVTGGASPLKAKDAKKLAKEIEDQDGMPELSEVARRAAGQHLAVARDSGGKVHGVITWKDTGKTGEPIYGRSLRAATQRQGIGKALMKRMAQDAHTKGKEIHLTQAVTGAVKYYEDMGAKTLHPDKPGLKEMVFDHAAVAKLADDRPAPERPAGIKVYRGLSDVGAAALRRGEMGHGMVGSGVYTSTSPSHAAIYGKGDNHHVMSGTIVGKIMPDDDLPRDLPEEYQGPKGRHELGYANDHGYDGVKYGSIIAVNRPEAVQWDDKTMTADEAEALGKP